jgi:hypothetical protein
MTANQITTRDKPASISCTLPANVVAGSETYLIDLRKRCRELISADQLDTPALMRLMDELNQGVKSRRVVTRELKVCRDRLQRELAQRKQAGVWKNSPMPGLLSPSSDSEDHTDSDASGRIDSSNASCSYTSAQLWKACLNAETASLARMSPGVIHLTAKEINKCQKTNEYCMTASAKAGCIWCMQQLSAKDENLLAVLNQGWNLWDCVHHHNGPNLIAILRFLEDRGLTSSDKYKKWLSKQNSKLEV